VSARFERTRRLLTASDFNGVFRGNNKRFGNRYWTLLVVIQQEAEASGSLKSADSARSARMGLAIAKKRARRAVDRNRLKRLARESFRLQLENLGSVDVVVMNRDPAALAESAELRHKLDDLWRQVADFSAKSGGFSKPSGPHTAVGQRGEHD